jgi:hypothetical protein
MTLKELLDKVSELCNEETKDLPVMRWLDNENIEVEHIWRYKFENDYTKFDEIRIS